MKPIFLRRTQRTTDRAICRARPATATPKCYEVIRGNVDSAAYRHISRQQHLVSQRTWPNLRPSFDHTASPHTAGLLLGVCVTCPSANKEADSRADPCKPASHQEPGTGSATSNSSLSIVISLSGTLLDRTAKWENAQSRE